MKTITCDVVKDLIPLYVDDVLSSDSRMLVEEHLQSCEKCSEYCKVLSVGVVDIPAKVENDKAVIKKIKKKINYKRLVTACVSAAVVAALSLSIFYAVFVREQYLPFAETGVYVEDETIKTKNEYQCFYGYEDPDDKSVFYMYLSTTSYHKHQQKDAPTEMFHLSDTDNTISTIYYIPEEYLDDFKNYSRGSNHDLTDEMLNELKDVAPLLWSAK